MFILCGDCGGLAWTQGIGTDMNVLRVRDCGGLRVEMLGLGLPKIRTQWLGYLGTLTCCGCGIAEG